MAINQLGGKRGFDKCLGIKPRQDVIAINPPRERSSLYRKVSSRPLILLTVTSDMKMKYRELLKMTLLGENRNTWRISCSGVTFPT
jgi:hypothetical protein